MLSLRIGESWGQDIGNGDIYDLEVQHVWAATGSGLNYVKWSMDLPDKFWHQSLVEGTKVEVFNGDVKLGAATLAEVDRANWTFVADGLFRQAEKFEALKGVDGSDQSQTLDDVVASAIERGLMWASIGNIGAIDVELGSTIAQSLTTYCETNMLRWGVDENDVPFITTDPYVHSPAMETQVPGSTGTPQWAVVPGTPLMPFSDELFITKVHVVYDGGLHVSSGATGDMTLPGGRELTIYAEPGTDVGEAQTIAAENFRRNALRYGFTEGLDLFPGELITPGGTPIEPWATYKMLGSLGIHYGAINEKNNSAVGETVQWVMGTITYRGDTDSVQIASVDFQPRTLAGGFHIISRMSEIRIEPR